MSIKDIVENSEESLFSLCRERLLKEKWVEEECSSCGYNEIIIGKESVALRLDYVDGDVTNNTLENLRLLCPNCFLSHNGHMPSSERFYK